jgi:dTDP-4-amino-4,6-dideoxygalactose transaminase
MRIPFVDLKAQYHTIKDEIDSVVTEVMETTQFVGGKKLAGFEESFAQYVDAKFGVGCSSGTAALHLGLTSLGIGPGDEVITAANTFIATTEAITHAGAKPVLADVLEDTQLIDPASVKNAITPRTKAIIPVHLFGQSADMTALGDIARQHGLKIVADAAQAHGSKYKGSRKAIQGDVTCFSFYPGKNLGAYGDAGMMVTDDEKVADRARMLGNHGRYAKYEHLTEGYNYRLDAMQAAILGVKLRHLDKWTELRRSRAQRYDAALNGNKVRPVKETPDNYHVYHLYVVRVADRDRVLKALGQRDIAAGIHYPIPLHLQKAYSHLRLGEGAFPVAEKVAKEIVSLPMYPELTDEMVDTVVTALEEITS